MKIAIPTREGKVDDHFGHCDHYTIAEVNSSENSFNKSVFNAPPGCGCKSDIATQLKEIGVTTMLAGSMGDGAMNKLTQADIKVIRGCSGDVDILLNSYTSGFIIDSGIGCASHEHNCEH